MGARQKEIDKLRMAGMTRALEIVKEGGQEALEKEIETMKRTGINPPIRLSELEGCIDDIKSWSLRRAGGLYAAALHDMFGFGSGRMKRVFEAINEACRLINTGEATWLDYSQSIEEQMGFRLRDGPKGTILFEEVGKNVPK